MSEEEPQMDPQYEERVASHKERVNRSHERILDAMRVLSNAHLLPELSNMVSTYSELIPDEGKFSYGFRDERGLRQGLWIEWWPYSGVRKSQGKYRYDYKRGTWREWDENGNIFLTLHYDPESGVLREIDFNLNRVKLMRRQLNPHEIPFDIRELRTIAYYLGVATPSALRKRELINEIYDRMGEKIPFS